MYYLQPTLTSSSMSRSESASNGRQGCRRKRRRRNQSVAGTPDDDEAANNSALSVGAMRSRGVASPRTLSAEGCGVIAGCRVVSDMCLTTDKATFSCTSDRTRRSFSSASLSLRAGVVCLREERGPTTPRASMSAGTADADTAMVAARRMSDEF